MAPAPAPQMNAAQMNLMARNAVVSQGVKRTQLLYSGTVDVDASPQLNIPPRNVGLILGFIVNVRGTVDVAGGGSALTKTPFGAANLVQSFQFQDLNNNTRINTTGWHMAALNSARANMPYLAVDALSTSPAAYPVDYGQYWTRLMNNTASIAAGASGTTNFTWFVPLAYSETDLRGSVYAGVVNATMNLQINFNQNAIQARTLQGWSDAVYATATSGTAVAGVTQSDLTVEIYQVYYDQLPMGKSGVILPMFDLATIYDIKNTAVQGIVAGQDFPVPYSNFRDFLSTFAVYRNKTSVAGSFAADTDLTYLTMQAANYTNIWKVAPQYAGMWGRQSVGLDFPGGMFYLPSRQKPISTNQFGNTELVFNANDVQTGATVLVGYESFALTNTITQAQSLAPA